MFDHWGFIKCNLDSINMIDTTRKNLNVKKLKIYNSFCGVKT